MKKYLLGFALIAVLTTTGYSATDEPATTTKGIAPASDSGPAMKVYDYPDLGMGFSMQEEPKSSNQTVDTKVGKLLIHMYTLDKGDRAFIVGVNEYPAGSLPADTDKALEGARDGSLASLKAEAVSQKKITLGKYPGLEFEFKGGGFHGKYRVYLVGNRLYQIASLAANGTEVLEGTDKFMDSFHLLNQ